MAKNLGQISALWISDTAPTNTNMIWLDTRVTGTGLRHRYYDLLVGDWVFFNPNPNFRHSITQSTTVIQIPEQSDTDYEIEVVKYKINDNNLNNGRDLIRIDDAGKTINSFTVNVNDQFNNGTLIYRILNF